MARMMKMWHKGDIMIESSRQMEVHLGRQGRLVIPAVLRRLLGFEEGDILVARPEAGRLILEKQETIKRRLKDRFSRLPQATSLADELIAERHEAAKREMGE